MNLQDLQAFVAFAETGSIAKASARIHLTPSATTRRIQRFEHALGTGPLLDRAVKPPVLTPNGRVALGRCRAVLSSMRELAGADGDEPRGELRLGVAHGLGDMVLGRPLDLMRRRFPGLSLGVSSHWSSALLQEVRLGRLDAAIGVLVDDAAVPPGVQVLPLDDEPLQVIASRELHLPRAARGGLSLAQLGELPWVLAPAGCAYRARLEQACHREGHEVRVAAEVMERDLRVSLVARGLGLALMTPRVLKASRAGSRLRRVPVRDFEPRVKLCLFARGSAGVLAPALGLLAQALHAG